MNATFKYKSYIRWWGLCFISFLGYFVFLFSRSSWHAQHTISSVIWAMFCVGAIGVALYLWNECEIRVTVADKGMRLKRPLKTVFVEWDDIAEYGREEKRYFGGPYRYYVRLRGRDKRKMIIFGHELKDIKVINAYILSKLEPAKLKNIGPGRI